MIKRVRSPDYNYDFNTETGMFARWGETLEDDPQWSPQGPEILDVEISTICRGGCQFCFPAGTKILTPEGEKNIEELKAGDIVYGCQTDQGDKYMEQTVEQTFVREFKGELVKIILEDGTSLSCTPNHEIFTKRGYVRAENLQEDDEILKF